MQDPSDQSSRWEAAERELQAEPPSGWTRLAEPLEPQFLDAMIDRAIARRARAEASEPSAHRARQRRWLVPVAASLALAASLAVFIRPPAAPGPFELDMQLGHAATRGEASQPRDQFLYSLRNEPGWTIRVADPSQADTLQLFLVAQTSSDTTLLDASIERRGAAFRVTGELRELGLPVGDVTLHFAVGPRTGRDAVLGVVQTHLVGEGLPSAWRVQSRQIRVTE